MALFSTENVPQMETEITAEYAWNDFPPELKGVRIRAEQNQLERMLEAPTGSAQNVFHGTSKEGNLQDALQAAIQMAIDVGRVGSTDVMVSWEVTTITGLQGGIAGFNS